MKTIHYAGDELLTGDEIADAVVEYAAALARGESSAALSIPTMDDRGEVVQVSMLLGPASQLIVTPATGDERELRDELLVARIDRDTRGLGIARAEVFEQMPASDEDYGV